MASNPVQRFFEAELEKQGGWDVIWDRVANAETLQQIAETYGISQGWLSRLISDQKHPERKQAFREAKRAASYIYAEQAQEMADGVREDKDAIAKVRERIGVRRWLSGAWNREQFGDVSDININADSVNILHLNALRHREVEVLNDGKTVSVLPGIADVVHQIGNGQPLAAQTLREESGDARAE